MQEPVLEEAAKLSIADKEDDASENPKAPKDPNSAPGTDVPEASAEHKGQDGEDDAPAADASPEVPLEKTDGVLQSSARVRVAVLTAARSCRCITRMLCL